MEPSGFAYGLHKMGIRQDRYLNWIFDNRIYAPNLFNLPGKIYYVDCRVTASGNGSSWAAAFKTIQEAITANNADIDWGATPWLVDNYILIASGEYAEALSVPFTCHMIGMGVLGTDTAVEIHPAVGSAMAGTFLGTHVSNIRFETTEATVDTLNIGTCNNSLIENCEIVCGVAGGGAGTAYISTVNCTHLRVYNCSFQYGGAGTPHNYGIYFGGGANKYAHHVDIRDNLIQGIRAAGVGIHIPANCTATNAVIRENIIKIPTTGKGIEDLNGNSLCVNNFITVAGAGDAISHAGGAGMTINNQTVVNGTALRETAYA